MELKTTKEFVLKAHLEACDKWKKEIEKEFPEAFENKLEVGKWYKHTWKDEITNENFMIFVRFKNIDIKGGIIGNGFNTEGEYFNSTSWGQKNTIWQLATPEEIETMLWQEAEKRGIGKDTKIENCLHSRSKARNCGGFGIVYDIGIDEIWNRNGCVYNKGKWATPLDPNKELKEQIEKMEQELKKLKERIK